MIKWEEIKDLHVISKLEQIISKWFGVELFFTDVNYKVRSHLLDQGYEFDNHFLNIQMQLDFGKQFLMQDVEKVTDLLQEVNEKSIIYDSCFPGLKGVASKIEFEGEYIGTVFAFPFIREATSQDELDKLKAFLQENGAGEEESSRAVQDLKRMYPREKETLRELLDFVADEIVSFHEEIAKRDEIIHELNSEISNKYRYHNLIGKSKGMQVVYRLLEKVSGSDSTILIQGDNGTGKELVAKAIHYNSPRKDAVFLAVNCSGFNDNLLDSELFGHVKGAFTGAVKDKKGLFEMANGGTLFLDEVGDTSPSMQVKLLRVLQEGTYLPVGSTQPRRVNVRVLAATNRPLKEMIKSGDFREDLYYRINVINVRLPSLRERKEDIPLLCEHFLEARCAEAGVPTKTISKKCLEKIFDFDWPGNVRELQNEVERLVVLAGNDKTITPDLLSQRIQDGVATHSGPSAAGLGINTNGSLKEAIEELEQLMIGEGLKRTNFNKSRLAKELGISRAGLIMKVDKYGFDKRKKAS